MEERIKDKVEEIEGLLSELNEIRVDSIEEYLDDVKTRAACERYFEKIVEAIMDLSFFVIREKELKMPEEDEGALKILAGAGIIDENLYSRLSNAKGMRNFIIHQYEKIDDELVFEALSGELEKDVTEFLDKIKKEKGK